MNEGKGSPPRTFTYILPEARLLQLCWAGSTFPACVWFPTLSSQGEAKLSTQESKQPALVLSSCPHPGALFRLQGAIRLRALRRLPGRSSSQVPVISPVDRGWPFIPQGTEPLPREGLIQPTETCGPGALARPSVLSAHTDYSCCLCAVRWPRLLLT